MTNNVERRRHERHASPSLLIVLEGHTYQATNWSLGGVLLNGYDGSRSIGEAIRGEFGFAGEAKRCSFEGLVVRVNHEKQEMAFGFAGLSDDAFGLLNSYAARRRETS